MNVLEEENHRLVFESGRIAQMVADVLSNHILFGLELDALEVWMYALPRHTRRYRTQKRIIPR
jgi:hypothetical protein